MAIRDIVLVDSINFSDNNIMPQLGLASLQLKIILAWCVLHQDELMQNWELAKDDKELNKINPLI